ncbi:glycosyltransferase family 2 protein [Microbacterium atlanticum]|uniref:glycosyltransferase family 2 protein n=1 Tax=Microbacterium atlanticum TaxID=2782168 RepID=UPI001889351A|nr:glycosyltransferase family 2 protein [Microbacterium atlanticum]
MHVAIVLNWHGRADTLECVRSILDGDADTEVLVVDNGSFDGVVETLAGTPRVSTLQLLRNLGFSGGMNRGIEWALGHGADTITILNNDTVVPPGALPRLASLAADAIAVSPTVFYRDDPGRIWFGGGTLDMPDGYPHHTAQADLASCVNGVRVTDVLAGCCITASAPTWRAVGLFDERFFLNFEDSEWSLRARSRGIRLLVACDVRILHAVSASFTGAAATLGSFYFLRNGLLFSKLAGAGPAARVRFLRRFGLAGLRRRSWRGRSRGLVVAGWAAACYLTRRFGEAPGALRRRVTRWASQPTV